MDDTKLKKIGAELSKARAKRDEWDRKVKDLERRYREAENTCIHDMVHAANLSPEDLAELIKKAFQAAAVNPVTSPVGSDFPAFSQKNQNGYNRGSTKEDQIQCAIGHFRPAGGKPG